MVAFILTVSQQVAVRQLPCLLCRQQLCHVLQGVPYSHVTISLARYALPRVRAGEHPWVINALRFPPSRLQESEAHDAPQLTFNAKWIAQPDTRSTYVSGAKV